MLLEDADPTVNKRLLFLMSLLIGGAVGLIISLIVLATT